MRKVLKTLITTFFFFLVITSTISAKVITMEKGQVEIAKSEVINDDLIIGAETVDIEGTINGDVFVGGKTVRVNGIINGDLHVGSGTFTLSGSVRDDVYVGAGNVSLSSAKIGDSLLVGAGNVNIDKNSTIGGSLFVGGGSVNLNAPVKRNVYIGAGSADINSQVGGEVRVAAGEISVGPSAKIGKDLYYAVGDSDTEPKISDSASVSGSVKKVDTGFVMGRKDFETAKGRLTRAFRGVSTLANIISFFGAVIVGLLWLKFFPNTAKNTRGVVSKSLFRSLGVGLLMSIAIIPALILLAITGVGLPLAGILFLLFLIAVYMAKIVVGFWLGSYLTEKFNWKDLSSGLTFTIGLFGVYILKAVPFLGPLFSLLVFWIGLGTLVLYFKLSLSQPSSKK